MQCDRAADLIGRYRDGELPPAERRALEAHISGCARCRDQLRDDARIGQSIREIGRVAPPAHLAGRVLEKLASIDREVAAATTGIGRSRPGGVGAWRAGAQRAAVLLVSCCLSAVAGWWASTSADRHERLVHDVVSAHIRSLMQDTQVQVASSDQHTVRPWFAGRTEFAPNARDLADQGFPLQGGRLEYIDGRRIGTIVYKRRQHVVNVFMWPAGPAAAVEPKILSRNGYSIVSMSRDGIAHWLVSDLNADELLALARLL